MNFNFNFNGFIVLAPCLLTGLPKMGPVNKIPSIFSPEGGGVLKTPKGKVLL